MKTATQATMTPTNFSFLNNANSPATQSQATMINSKMPSFSTNASSANTLQNLKTPNPAQDTQKLSLAQKNKQIGQDRLNSILNAKSADDLQKPKYQVGAGFGNYRAQKAAYNEQAQKFGINQNQNLTPEQKDDRARNIAGWTLAGIDSAVNIANAGMSYANMAKQWEMQNKMYELAAQQQQTENDRYNKREKERLDARDEARGAQQAVFGNRQWHDPSANKNEGESSEGEQNAEQEKTAFERD
ncbi:hypothetical protein [Helicobacter sp. T3_23-1056]